MVMQKPPAERTELKKQTKGELTVSTSRSYRNILYEHNAWPAFIYV